MTHGPDLSTADGQKRAAGEAAALLVEDGMTLGLGTGSTAAWFVRALAARVCDERLDVRGVPTSRQTEALARELGLTVIDLDEAGEIDLTVDGVDEIDPSFVAIKGGGGALLREKLVWIASRRCVVIADASKRVDRLGAFPLPIEVVCFGHRTTAKRLAGALDGLPERPAFRLRERNGAAFITDEGHCVYDLLNLRALGPLSGVIASQWLREPGVIEHGLFDRSSEPVGLADEALIATAGGVEHLFNTRKRSSFAQVRGRADFSTELERL